MKLALAGLALIIIAAPKPRPENLRVSVAGDTVVASWAWKSPLRSVDTGMVQFSVKPEAGSWTQLTPIIRTRATSAAKVIAMSTPSDSVRACVWVTTVGAANSPTLCAKKARFGPHPGPDSLEVTAIIVKPDSVSIQPEDTLRFCAGARLSDDTVVLATNSDFPICRERFATVPGFPAPSGMLIKETILGITIEAERVRELGPDGRLGEPYFIAKARVANATKVGDEWWLNKPIRLKELAS